MPAGLRVINSNGNLIIDERFFNYCFVSKHTLTFQVAGGPVTGGFGRQAFLTLNSGEAPIVAARSSKPFTASRARKVGANFEFAFISANFGGANPGDTIDVYVFDRPPVRTGAGYGLRVFDATGKCTFDSANKYMKVVDARTFNSATPTATVDIGGGTYAQIIAVPGFRWTGNQATPTADWQWAAFAGLVTTTFTGYTVAQYTTGEGTYAFFGNPAPIAANNFMSVIMVDVSQY